MAYDEALATRIRHVVAGERNVTEQKMFVRVDPATTEKLLATTGAEPFEMRGRAMNGWLRVDTEHLRTKQQLGKWVKLGVSYARSLPAK